MSAPTLAFTDLLIEEAAGTDDEFYFTCPFADAAEWKLKYATFVPATTAAAHAVNYVDLALSNGATALGTLSTAAVAFTAGTPRAFSLSGGALLEFTAGTDAVKVTNTNAGAGAACHGLLQVCWEKIN
jgi:hypothetical protein